MKRALSAFVDGVRRVLAAPAILAGAYVVMLLVTLPATQLVQANLASTFGNSLAADEMARGVNLEWWDHYVEDASGLGRTFTTNVIGFAAVLDNASRVLDGQAVEPAVVVLALCYALAWLFLSGGTIDRFARNRPVQALGFFGACGAYAFRFLRLALIGGIGYWIVMGPIHRFLFGVVYTRTVDDLAVERTAFVIRLALYVVFVGLLAAWTILIDYARVRTVVEDRRSMLGSFLAGSRFALRHPMKTGVLWLLNAVALATVLAVYAAVAPGVPDPAGLPWAALAIGQLYIVARLFLKLLTYASETSLFLAMQAHASYTAAPLPTWPESPAVEAVTGGPPEHGSGPGAL